LEALRLLTGDAQSFLDKVWASQVHVHHSDPVDLVGLLSLDDVDHLLTSTALRAPALRIAKDGNVLPGSSFTRLASLAGQPLTGLVDARKVLDLFDDGATVVLQGLHRYWPPLTRLVRELELALGHPGQANAYLTPPSAQGFAVHSDTHDVFVFQTHGTKQWEVHDDAGMQSVLLEPGVSMYLPTGTPHAARAHDTASLHVTIGINQVTWRQLLQRLASDLLKDEAYDGPVPAGYLHHPTDFTEMLTEHLEHLGAQIAGSDAGQLVADQTSRFLSTQTPALRGGLHDRLGLARIADDTVLERRPTAACGLVAEPERLRVLLGDRELRMPLRVEEPMRFLTDRAAVQPQDLSPWLDPQSRLVLTRRLVREGLLRIVG
jgi:mannose-6-phosphate isomerase-like protein (cupin superfamily)